MNAQGFILDLDGTLLDSMGVWEHLGEEYLRMQDVTAIPPDLNNRLRPMSLRQSADFLIDRFGIRRTPDQVIVEIDGMIADAYRHRVRLKPGVRGFLERNKAMRMGIATETDGDLAKAALRRLRIDTYFAFILTAAQAGGKQDPDIYRRAAEKLELPADEIIVFEDAPHAVESSRRAGFYTVGVYDAAFEAEQDRIRQTADAYVMNLNEFEGAAP